MSQQGFLLFQRRRAFDRNVDQSQDFVQMLAHARGVFRLRDVNSQNQTARRGGGSGKELSTIRIVVLHVMVLQ